MDEVKLLPCAHCGWSSGIEFSEAASAVICPDCFARGPVEDTEAEAIAAWNTRAIEATRPTEQGLGAIPGSHPTDQAPSGLGASRFDPERIRRQAYEDAAHVAEHLNGWGSPPAPELADHIAKCIRRLGTNEGYLA